MATPKAVPEAEQQAIETTPFDYMEVMPCEKYDIRMLVAQLVPPLYALVFVVGLLGNMMVVVILTKYRRLFILTNIYLLNLAISDLLFLVTLPFWIHQVMQEWVFGYGMCKLVSGLYSMGLYGAAFFVIMLTIDRYLAVVYPVSALRARTVSFGIRSSVFTWVLVVLAALPELIFFRDQKEQEHSSCSPFYPEDNEYTWKHFYIVKMNILSLALPLLIMVVCYSGIIRTLVRCPNKMKCKAIRLIFIIMVVFFIFWAPYNVVLLLHTFQMTSFGQSFGPSCQQNKQLDLAMTVTEVIAYTHCCVNPVIYAFVGERFRGHLDHFFHRHVAVCPSKCVQFLISKRPERGSSTSPSSVEQELSAIF